MIVSEAKDRARRWVAGEGSKLPGFQGAYLPITSDVDLHVVLDGLAPAEKLGKFVYNGALLEVSFTTVDQLGSVEQIFGDHQRASAFERRTLSRIHRAG